MSFKHIVLSKMSNVRFFLNYRLPENETKLANELTNY